MTTFKGLTLRIPELRGVHTETSDKTSLDPIQGADISGGTTKKVKNNNKTNKITRIQHVQ